MPCPCATDSGFPRVGGRSFDSRWLRLIAVYREQGRGCFMDKGVSKANTTRLLSLGLSRSAAAFLKRGTTYNMEAVLFHLWLSRFSFYSPVVHLGLFF